MEACRKYNLSVQYFVIDKGPEFVYLLNQYRDLVDDGTCVDHSPAFKVGFARQSEMDCCPQHAHANGKCHRLRSSCLRTLVTECEPHSQQRTVTTSTVCAKLVPTKISKMDQADWWQQTLPRLIETAKSGRSKCGVCRQPIDKGVLRVGIQKWTRNYRAVTWHHQYCVDVMPIKEEITETQSSIEETKSDQHTTREHTNRFYKAARMAVEKDAKDFRMLQFDGKAPTCPISGQKLTKDNSHAHHFGPHSFEAIVKSFLRDKNIDLRRVSITAGRFSNETLAQAFYDYHWKKARFLLVHATANLSILKLNPRLGPCDICKLPRSLTWIFTSGFCKKCIKSDDFRARFINQKYACRSCCLTPSELAALQFQSLPNPKNSGFAPMKMFRREDVETVAIEKFGSLQTVQQERKIRCDHAHDIRSLRYQAAASFTMILRKERETLQVEELSDQGEDDATPAQLRYLMYLGAPRMVGMMSKSLASKKIVEFKEKKKCKSKIFA